MSDLISRQAVLDKAYELDLSDTGNDIQVWVVDVAEVEKLPSATTNIMTVTIDLDEKQFNEIVEGVSRRLTAEAEDAEPKKGKWIREPNCWYRCSECGDHYPSMRNRMDYGFCPNCGARMEE